RRVRTVNREGGEPVRETLRAEGVRMSRLRRHPGSVRMRAKRSDCAAPHAQIFTPEIWRSRKAIRRLAASAKEPRLLLQVSRVGAQAQRCARRRVRLLCSYALVGGTRIS